jgi:hypothetical protein
LAADKVLLNRAYPILKSKMDNSQIKNKYKQCISRFIDKRSKELFATAPYDRIYFGEEDSNDFFTSLGIHPNDISNIIKDTYYGHMGDFNPRTAKDPITVSIMMIIKYLYDALKKCKSGTKQYDDANKELGLSMIYLSFSGGFYPSIHYGSFPKVQPSEYPHVMDYVVNNLLTNKFDLKREGSVFAAIKSVNQTWVESYEDLFDDFDDENIVYLIQQLHNRIKSFMKNIAELYYDTYDNKDNVFTYDSDNLDEDGYRLADNDSLKIERSVENTMNYINSNSIDYTICKRSADSNVRADEVKSIIEMILGDNGNIPEIKELTRCIIADYFQNSKTKDLRDLKFLSYSMTVKPNSKEPLVLRQKDIVTGWLQQYSQRYVRNSKRPATQSSYFKSVLGYFVVLISRSNK